MPLPREAFEGDTTGATRQELEALAAAQGQGQPPPVAPVAPQPQPLPPGPPLAAQPLRPDQYSRIPYAPESFPQDLQPFPPVAPQPQPQFTPEATPGVTPPQYWESPEPAAPQPDQHAGGFNLKDAPIQPPAPLPAGLDPTAARRAALGERREATARATDAAVAENEAALDKNQALSEFFERNAAQAEAVADKFDAQIKTKLDDRRREYEKYSKMEVKDYWADKSQFNRIMTAIAVGLGGYGSSINGGPNYALNIVNKAMASHQERQKKLMERQLKLYQMRGAEVDELREMRAEALDTLKVQSAGQLKRLEYLVTDKARRASNERIRANGDALAAQLSFESAKLVDESTSNVIAAHNEQRKQFKDFAGKVFLEGLKHTNKLEEIDARGEAQEGVTFVKGTVTKDVSTHNSGLKKDVMTHGSGLKKDEKTHATDESIRLEEAKSGFRIEESYKKARSSRPSSKGPELKDKALNSLYRSVRYGVPITTKGTESEKKNLTWYLRMENATTAMRRLAAKGYNPTSIGESLKLSALRNELLTGDTKLYAQVILNIATAVGRHYSGATVTEKEFQKIKNIYLPMWSENEATVREKWNNLLDMTEGFKAGSGLEYHKYKLWEGGKRAKFGGKAPPNYLDPGTIQLRGKRGTANQNKVFVVNKSSQKILYILSPQQANALKRRTELKMQVEGIGASHGR